MNETTYNPDNPDKTDNLDVNAEIQPTDRTGGQKNACLLKKDCTALYGIFLDIARTIYSTKEGRTFSCPDVQWMWDGTGISDDDKSTVWIDTELKWEDKHPDSYPGIYVSLSQLQSQPLAGTSSSYAIGSGMPNGAVPYARRVAGSVTFAHVATAAGEAYGLADNTERWLTMLSDSLRRTFDFKDLKTTARVPLQKMEQGQSNGQRLYMSSVTMEFSFVDSWMVREETPILKEFGLAFENFTPSGHPGLIYGNINTEMRVESALVS